MVDIQNRDILEAFGFEIFENFLVNLITGFGKNLTRDQADGIFRQISAIDISVFHLQIFKPGLNQLLDLTNSQLLTSFKDNFTGIGIDQILLRLGTFQRIAIERNAPTIISTLEFDSIIVSIENFF